MRQGRSLRRRRGSPSSGCKINDIFGRTFGRRASRPKESDSFISIEWSYTPGTPPPMRALPAALEKQTRRIVECSVCSNHYAVYSATSFCPVCGPRPATARVLEAISAARDALALEDGLGEDEREALRAAGVFERFAVDAIESTVSLFEMFAREQFAVASRTRLYTRAARGTCSSASTTPRRCFPSMLASTSRRSPAPNAGSA